MSQLSDANQLLDEVSDIIFDDDLKIAVRIRKAQELLEEEQEIDEDEDED